MKKITTIVLFIGVVSIASAQIDAGNLMGLPTATTTEMNNITGASIGQILYNTVESTVYYFTSTGWQRATDDQLATEVNLNSAVDSNGDSTNETTVEDVIQAITPITSASGRIFYPPSIEIDASTNGTGRTVNLYQEYVDQFGSGNADLVRSIDAGTTAPDIPIYAANELYYYVTYFDPLVFSNISIDGATGMMSYDIIGQPADFNSLINVVFVVK